MWRRNERKGRNTERRGNDDRRVPLNPSPARTAAPPLPSAFSLSSEAPPRPGPVCDRRASTTPVRNSVSFSPAAVVDFNDAPHRHPKRRSSPSISRSTGSNGAGKKKNKPISAAVSILRRTGGLSSSSVLSSSLLSSSEPNTPIGRRRPRFSSSSSKNTRHNNNLHLAADEIDRLLLDVANTSNAANQLVDHNDDEDELGNDDDDDDDIIYEGVNDDNDDEERTDQGAALALALALALTEHRRGRMSFARLRRSMLPSNDGGVGAASSRNTTIDHRHPNDLTEQDVNAYGLFDSAGADEARLRLQIQRRRRRDAAQPRTNTLSTTASDPSEEESLLQSLFSTTTELHCNLHSSQSAGVIYDLKKYGSMPSFFAPILIVLTSIFCLLVVLRLMVSLLTVAVGWLVVILLSGRLLHQLRHRPLHLFRLLHARPIPAWAFLGGLYGMTRVCWNRVLAAVETFLLMDLLQFQSRQLLQTAWIREIVVFFGVLSSYALPKASQGDSPEDEVLEYCPVQSSTFDTFIDQLSKSVRATETIVEQQWDGSSTLFNATGALEATLTGFAKVFSMQQDLVLIWGLLHGLVFGIQVGILWLAVLGHAARPSQLADWFYYNIWRFAQRHYRELVRQQRQARHVRSLQQRRELLRWKKSSVSSVYSSTAGGDAAGGTAGGDERKQCMICLEDFFDDDDENVSSLYQRHVLLCRHSFHACCIQEWLEIKASCPICRIPLDEAIVTDDANSTVRIRRSFVGRTPSSSNFE